MRFSVSVRLGDVTVQVEPEANDVKGALSELESFKDDLRSLISFARSVKEEIGPATPSATHQQYEGSPEEFLGNHADVLQKSSQIDQLVAILFAKSKLDPNVSLSPAEMGSAFPEFGFQKPVNPSDTLAKAVRKGWVTPVGGDRGKYRLTIPGRNHAKELLGFQS